MKSNSRFCLTLFALLFLTQSCSDSKPTVTLNGADSSADETATLTELMSGTIDATSLKLKVYAFAVSESLDCSNPITIFSNTSGEEKDIATNPSFGSGRVDAATYPCVMIEMSKIIKTSASSTSGFCTSGVEFSDVICNDGQESQLIDGTSVTCSGGSSNDQKVVAFINTNSAGTGGDRALLPPLTTSDTTSGIVLTAPFVVEGDITGTLSVSLHNFLGSDAGVCFTSPPPFTFE